MTEPRKVIIDTDPGIDDAFALLLAFASPELRVRGVTVVAGNVGLERTVSNAGRLLAYIGAHDCPLAAGCARPLGREPLDAAHIHGEDGLGGASELLPPPVMPRGIPAARLILDLAAANPGEITLITLGPMTNAATAFLLDPARFRKLAGVVAMGGAFTVPGNVTAAAEYNIYADPHAARLVLRSGVPVTMVGLDVTRHVSLTSEDLEGVSEFVRRAASFRAEAMQLHDPLAVGAVIDSALVDGPLAPVDVEVGGQITTGATIADLRPHPELLPNARIALSVDTERFLTLFRERVLRRA